MKFFVPILVALFIVVAVIGGIRVISDWSDAHQSAWQVEAIGKAMLNIKDYDDQVRSNAERRAWFTEFYRIMWVSLLVVVVGGAGIYSWVRLDERKESWARAVDGSFALQTFKNAKGQTWVTDPNKATFGVFGFNKTSGELTTDAPMIGADRQLTYAQAVQRTRTAQATALTEIRNSAQAKYASGFYERPQSLDDYKIIDEPARSTAALRQPLTAFEAFTQSDSNRWVLGQSPTTGELFELNPKEAAHFGIVGATGTGKTAYTALLLMAYAVRNKYRVVIMDGKGGADWSKYHHIVEYCALDYANVGNIVSQMMSEYERRQAILNQYGVNSIWELPSGVIKPRPTMFIIDEFGATMDSLKAANKTAYKAVELDLGNLLRLSRGAGLYVVLCDQNPSKWPSTVRANLPVNLCYRLGGGIGNAVQEYNLDRLERVGQFQVSNAVYNAFPTYQAINELLPDGSYKKPLALLTVNGTVTGYGKEGGDTGQDPTPQSVIVEPVIAPVTDGYTQVTAVVIGNKEPVTPMLIGAPITVTDKAKVRNIYAITRSKSETCRLVWGGKNGQRMAWLNEVLASEMQQ